MGGVIGIAFFVSPWLAVLLSVFTRNIPVEYHKYGMRRFPLYSGLILSAFAYCTYNVNLGDIGILTAYLKRIGDRPLLEYRMPDIVAAIGPFNWLFFFIAQSRDYALMCMIPCFVMYYIYGKITSDVAIEKNVHFSVFVISYVIGMLLLQFYSIIEHGRFMMAGCILVYAIYRELYRGKRDAWSAILYILPLCFHLAILPLYAFRFFSKFFLRNKCIWFSAIAMAYIMIMFSGNLISFLPFFMSNYIMKARSFFRGESDWGQYVFFHSFFYRTLRVVFNMVFAVITFMISKILKSTKHCKDKTISKGKRLFFSFILQLVYFSFITNLIVSEAFWRFGTLLFFMVPMALIYAKEYMTYGTYHCCKYALAGLGMIIFIMHIAMIVKNNFFVFDDFIGYAKGLNIFHVILKDLFMALRG